MQARRKTNAVPYSRRAARPCISVTAEDLLPVLLNARGAQPREPVLVDGILPGEEFLDGERVAAAGLLERKKPAAHCRDHLGLATDDPPLRAWRRQVRDRKRAAVRPD